ncbi:hypothetical protein UC8_36390 [Roseimaritima ulvae]|uniref:Uncharacterized protein n=1 Tax=Roseimaritima ulvae TaxID=980254 RepID=A0A5B9QRI5_9BACT|nr:hypothetical protein UC8_36390 [Roseimaritima ulvae]
MLVSERPDEAIGNFGQKQFQCYCCDLLSPELLADPVADVMYALLLEAADATGK